MGVDAESQDLTTRVRAKRKALIAAGEVTPARPGEHGTHGRTGPVDAAALDRVARAAEARERREPEPVDGGGKVYDFVYTEEELAEMRGEAAPEAEPEHTPEVVLELGEPEPDEVPVALTDEELEVFADRELAENVLVADTDVLLRLAGLEAQGESISNSLLLLATALADLPTTETLGAWLREAAKLAAAPPQEPVGIIRRFWRWLW